MVSSCGLFGKLSRRVECTTVMDDTEYINIVMDDTDLLKAP